MPKTMARMSESTATSIVTKAPFKIEASYPCKSSIGEFLIPKLKKSTVDYF
ncbi:hypothetical protein N646_0064 [Vibrio alginolyticus NBRC 15630 = ATCC 17749]|uniref:Uncharacterized protein n=1 Tax=Vibrio alginolyticus (strain ATCC 17749 / DSM 2171 / NBRC 15630 / NCIMB 1903 / NCTC 12160 / XII-53) TaxID=1219076 RepID=A0A2I3BY96_VIBAX|nr:hypothetical protein N646_0064 [Vibrio alginolyticus NBRC 15630 = ATCC 17749]